MAYRLLFVHFPSHVGDVTGVNLRAELNPLKVDTSPLPDMYNPSDWSHSFCPSSARTVSVYNGAVAAESSNSVHVVDFLT